MSDRAKARLTGRFPAGTKVGLYRDHVGGGALRADDEKLGGAIKTATVGADQVVEFDGLDAGERLFVGGFVTEDVPRPGERVPRTEWRSVSITAQAPADAQKPLSDEKVREQLAQTISPHELEPDRTVVGARDSRSLTRGGQPFSSDAAGKPTPGGVEGEQVPHLRQEDARDVEQRSATITGQATPVDPNEQVPRAKAVDGIDLEQRSATPFGELTPVSPGEQVPRPTQDAVRHLEQRSATPHGSGEPIPQGDPVDIQRAKEGSAAKAIGNPADPGVVQAAVESKVGKDGDVEFAAKVSDGAEPNQHKPAPVEDPESAVDDGADDDEGAEKRSEAAKKAARTRKEREAKADAEKAAAKKKGGRR